MVDKRPIGYIPGKGNPLDKKVPTSKKYQNVETKLKTGSTVKDISIVSDKQVSKRKNELFKRIKPSTLSNLLKQDKNFESIYQMGQEENKDDIPDDQSIFSSITHKTNQSEASKISAITYATDQLGITDETCFLLLDLRDPDEYELYHIQESKNFPQAQLSRDKFLNDIFRFKNKEDKMIIVYHLDERAGIPCANLFAQKGFDNVFLISGGIEDFMNQFPEQIEGTKVPVLPKKDKQNSDKKQIVKRSNYKETNSKVDLQFKNDFAGDKQAKKISDNHSQTMSQANQSEINSQFNDGGDIIPATLKKQGPYK